MGIKALRFEGVKERADKFKKIAQSHSLIQEFSIESEAEIFLKENSLAPIIGTICDQYITAEDAWVFPHWLSNRLSGEFSARLIYNLGKREIKDLLRTFMENKWPSGMAGRDREKYLENISRYIIDTCKLIIEAYENDPDDMFKNGEFIVPEIYFILRTVPGIGPKKASMIARDFVKAKGAWYEGMRYRLKKKGVEFKIGGKHLSEVPVDVQVVKVFGRIMGEFKNTPPRERFLDYWPDIQNFAKLAFPDFPGKIDEVLWGVGRQYCHESQPNCKDCPLKNIPCEYAKRWR